MMNLPFFDIVKNKMPVIIVAKEEIIEIKQLLINVIVTGVITLILAHNKYILLSRVTFIEYNLNK